MSQNGVEKVKHFQVCLKESLFGATHFHNCPLVQPFFYTPISTTQTFTTPHLYSVLFLQPPFILLPTLQELRYTTPNFTTTTFLQPWVYNTANIKHASLQQLKYATLFVQPHTLYIYICLGKLWAVAIRVYHQGAGRILKKKTTG